MHHVAYEVDDLPAELARLQGEGAELIDAAPRQGLFGMQVAFVHPESSHGVLSELVPVADRVRIEIGFDGGQVMGAMVETGPSTGSSRRCPRARTGALALTSRTAVTRWRCGGSCTSSASPAKVA